MPMPMEKKFTVEKIVQYKKGDMIVLTKFKPEWGFEDNPDNPALYTPYLVDTFDPAYHYSTGVTIPVVYLAPMYDVGYQSFGHCWIPVEIIEHAKSMTELTKFIKDKVKEVEGA
jgi:hypothetical protein